MGQGRGALGMAWRQRVHAESSTGLHIHYATLLWHSLQFYEHIGHDRHLEQSILFKFPLYVLLCTLSTYKWKRALLLDGAFAAPLWPSRGIVAGGASA
eukprot:8813610-Pyramimonas_sp.AAC.1